jgi:8-oxo-dGTP diphosphatase
VANDHVGRHAVVGVILVAEGRILLGHRHPTRQHYPDCWDVPGGHLQPGESGPTALRRELREEIGIGIDVGGRRPDFRLLGNDYDLQIWIVSAWNGNVANHSPHEHDQLAWFTAEELTSLTLADPQYLDVLTAAISLQDNP